MMRFLRATTLAIAGLTAAGAAADDAAQARTHVRIFADACLGGAGDFASAPGVFEWNGMSKQGEGVWSSAGGNGVGSLHRGESGVACVVSAKAGDNAPFITTLRAKLDRLFPGKWTQSTYAGGPAARVETRGGVLFVAVSPSRDGRVGLIAQYRKG